MGGGAHFKSRPAVPTQPVATRTKSLRSVLLAGSHQHLPVLNYAQTLPPPPRLECHPLHSSAGFTGLQQGRLLHWILFVLLFGADILDSGWVCT